MRLKLIRIVSKKYGFFWPMFALVNMETNDRLVDGEGIRIWEEVGAAFKWVGDNHPEATIEWEGTTY